MSINDKTKKMTLAAAIASALTACGGTGQDEGRQSSSANQTFSGQAIDGYVARAQVFLDTNNNGTRDAWEPQVFTDNEGYFGSNPNTNVDYCSDKSDPQYQLHCLVSDTAYSNVVVRIKGGYDLSTGEPFLGQMSRRIQVGEDNPIQGAVNRVLVTPLTSVLVDAESKQERDGLLEALDLKEDDLNVDYFKAGEINTKVLKKALTIHKTAMLLSDRLNDTYDEMGKGFGVADDATSSVYKALNRELIKALKDNPLTTGQTDYVEDKLKSEAFLRQVLTVSEQEVRDIYDQRKIKLPNKASQALATQANAFDTVIERAKNLPDIAKSLFNNSSPTQSELTSGVKALETLVIKVVKDDSGNDSGVSRVLNLYKQGGQVLDSLLTTLEKPGADLNTLAKSDFNFTSTTDFDQKFVNTAVLPEVVNKTLTLSDEAKKYDVNGSSYKFKDSQIILYFQGDQGASQGKVTACAKYIDGAEFDAEKEAGKQFKLGQANTTGEVIVGQWTKLDDRQLLVKANYLGSSYQWLIKPKGENRYQFDFDGKLTIWKADQKNGAEVLSDLLVENIPTSNAECKEKLPLRINGIQL